MKYVAPFERIKGHVHISRARTGATRMNASNKDIVRLIQALPVGIEVDEVWYLERN